MIEIIKEIARLQKKIEENDHHLVSEIHSSDGAKVLVYTYEEFEEIAGDNPVIIDYQSSKTSNFRCRMSTNIRGVEVYTYLTEEEYKKAVAGTTTKEKNDSL